MVPSFWIEFRGATRLWVASVVFVLLGLMFLLLAPDLFESAPNPLGVIAIRVLGWTFLGLGLLVLLPMLATIYVARKHPGRDAVWRWWINLIGGAAGALAFAVPATLMFPVFVVAYLGRPNALFPRDDASDLWVGALFSILGVGTLAALWFLIRLKLRNETRRDE